MHLKWGLTWRYFSPQSVPSQCGGKVKKKAGGMGTAGKNSPLPAHATVSVRNSVEDSTAPRETRTLYELTRTAGLMCVREIIYGHCGINTLLL